MKIRTIMCNSSEGFYHAHCGIRQAMSTEDMQLEVVNIASGPLSLESAFDEAAATPFILKQVISAEEDGCDAAVIDCAADPVLRAAREVSEIPVVSAGEAGYHAAMMVCDRFSVITVMPATAHLICENIRKFGFESRVASIRAADIPVLDLENEEKAFQAIFSAAEKAMNLDGAEAVVLGCTGMMALRSRLQAALGVPVIEPLTTAVKYARVLVEAGLRPSRVSYPAPAEASVQFIRSL